MTIVASGDDPVPQGADRVTTRSVGPGVGHLTARTFMAAIDDPGRCRSSQQVGADLGLVPRRRPSGEVDQAGRITRCGDGLARHLLDACANVILSILKQPCGLKAWAERLEARLGANKARVALARKLAVLMHRRSVTGEACDWQRQPQAA
jgi:transposase